MLVPGPKVVGVIVAAPAPLFVNILFSPTVVPFAIPTARVVPELHIINVCDVEAFPADVISEEVCEVFFRLTEPVPLPSIVILILVILVMN